MRRILIANRGEIACRVIRAAQGLGMETVAVYSEADAGALHVELADAAVCVGPAPARQSYLDAGRVLDAAIAQGADGVHPGYGFLSEHAAFATNVAARGLVWIGPSPSCMTDMGDKSRARQIAHQCGVPVLEGSETLTGLDEAALLALGERTGYPLLVKAAGGGGGIGMRRVDGPDALVETVQATQQMAGKAFGDDSVFLERFVARARHVEIQVFGFGDGRAVHLYERDCSVQRRFQKIVEESPAPGLPAAVRERMAQAAVALASHQRYAGPGTVEFLVDADSFDFFFLEMNTRIQVEHCVTEMTTGMDLVQAQIRQAAGTLAPFDQAQVQPRGVAIECRVYAEDPSRKFMPSPGRLSVCEFPAAVDGLRIETGVRGGDTITPFYDPMIAKLIAWGEDRDAALARLDCALAETRIEGVRTNLVFLRRFLAHPAFRAGQVDTALVERERDALLVV